MACTIVVKTRPHEILEICVKMVIVKIIIRKMIILSGTTTTIAIASIITGDCYSIIIILTIVMNGFWN